MGEQEREIRFRKLSQPELAGYVEREATVIIPIGAIEQHAAHLPVETDIYNAEQVSTQAARRDSRGSVSRCPLVAKSSHSS